METRITEYQLRAELKKILGSREYQRLTRAKFTASDQTRLSAMQSQIDSIRKQLSYIAQKPKTPQPEKPKTPQPEKPKTPRPEKPKTPRPETQQKIQKLPEPELEEFDDFDDLDDLDSRGSISDDLLDFESDI
jgi:hypothetical protein